MAPEVFSLQTTPSHPVYISQSKSVRIVLSTDHHEYTKFRGFHLKYKEGNVYMCVLWLISLPVYP